MQNRIKKEPYLYFPVFRLGHLREAKDFFERALKSNKDFLPAVHNLENLASALVERWHFRMLNDANRNESYREAILKKVRQGYTSVLDIGTGTSLFRFQKSLS
jgi:type II protein arginine methyltransferase